MPDPLRILFIGETGADSIAAELQRGGYDPAFEHATTREELSAALGAGCDIAISDFAVGDFGALEALRIIPERGIDLPLIVVSGEIAEADILAALKAGAADHLRRGALMRLNAAVEREIRAAKMRRGRARLEEQFRQAQKMEAVGRMAGGVAHDFNNLLTVITGYSDLLLAGGDLKDSQRTALEEIRRSAERGAQLTHQLLAFSRRQPLEPHIVRVNELLIRIEQMLRRLIGEDIELVAIPAASRDAVAVDSGGLEQVIMNLVVNARDAMPQGGRITVRVDEVNLEETAEAALVEGYAGRCALLSVTDTGMGIPKDELPRIFERFFRGEQPREMQLPGTGLGLAIVKDIVDLHGWRVTVESQVGCGSTFKVWLPLA